jgi:hypothetical protein
VIVDIMRLPAASAVLACVLLAGCALSPPKEARWQGLHGRIYEAATTDQALNAADQVLRLADHKFRVTRDGDTITATRYYALFAGISTQYGYDHWLITATPTEKGVDVEVQISRDADADVLMPIIGGSSAVGGTVANSSPPGKPVTARFPYRLFFARMDYLLQRSSEWPTCSEAMASMTTSADSNSGLLCGRGFDDRRPDRDRNVFEHIKSWF